MSTHDRHIIALLLSSLPAASPSTEPCNEANPFLWKIWCQMNNRTDTMSPTVWTEADVTYSSVMIIAKHLRELTATDS
jgi:hypothetical protein